MRGPENGQPANPRETSVHPSQPERNVPAKGGEASSLWGQEDAQGYETTQPEIFNIASQAVNTLTHMQSN